MKNHHIVSLVSGCCLLLAGVFIVVPLITNNWVVLSINIKIGPLVVLSISKVRNVTEFVAAVVTNLGVNFMPTISSPPHHQPIINLISPHILHILENVSMNTDISFGLKKCCLDVNVHGLQDQFQTLFNNKIRKFPCKKFMWLSNKLVPVTDKANGHDRKVINNFKSTMDTVFTCMLIALFAVVLATITSTVKSPCVKYGKNNVMVYLTIALCVVAVIFCMSGVILVNKNIKHLHDHEESRELTLKYSVGVSKAMKEFADNVKMKDKKGVAFGLVCGAIVVLLAVVFLNVLEFFLAQNKALDEYGTGLLSVEGYSLAASMES